MIATLDVLQGWLPSRALELVLLWAQMHRVELMENWRRLSEQQASYNKIEPLP